MRVLILIAAATLLTAGCVQTPTEKNPFDAAPDEVLLPTFAPIRVGIGGDAETSLHVSPDGQTILACSHGGFTQPSPLWFSTDAGASFHQYIPTEHPPSGDCDVSIGPEGNWYMLYDTIYSASVARSTDNGESWQIVYTAAVPFGGVDRPWIQAAGRNIVYMTYANVMVAEPAVDMFAKSMDGGATWTTQRLMARVEDPAYPNAVVGRMVLADDNRTIRVPLARTDTNSDDAAHVFDVAESRDAGETWRSIRVHGPVDAPLQVPGLTRAGDGTLYFVVTSGPVGAATVSFIASKDDGKTWSEAVVIAEEQTFPGLSGVWIDGRSDGSATLAWMHTVDVNDTTAWTVTVARLDTASPNPVVFVKQLFEPVVGDQSVYEFLMVKHDAQDRAYILYALFGEGCTDQPPAGASGNRNSQCVWLQVEEAPGMLDSRETDVA